MYHSRTVQKEWDTTLSFRHEEWKTASIKDAHHKFADSKKPKTSGKLTSLHLGRVVVNVECAG